MEDGVKAPASFAHIQEVGADVECPAIAAVMPERLQFSTVYRENFDLVVRWTRALGGPSADLEDLAQEVFLVVHRKLAGFDGQNLRGWLYRITAYTVSDRRRRAWFRRLCARPPEELDPPDRDPGPAELYERKQAERTLYALLSRLSEKRRVAFVLYEIVGHSCEEIASLLGVPVATVWTRLHHARAAFLKELGKLPRGGAA
jgi:RNA polymerase sigma-70 factor (ECF subfamily)